MSLQGTMGVQSSHDAKAPAQYESPNEVEQHGRLRECRLHMSGTPLPSLAPLRILETTERFLRSKYEDFHPNEAEQEPFSVFRRFEHLRPLIALAQWAI